jgi:hypothetical protein
MLRTTAAVGAVALSIGLTAFAGPALAGNGNGSGNGNGGAAATSPGHGNSAAAPGQHKKGQVLASSSASTKGSAGQNTPSSPGVKPTNATLKNQWAPASSNKTKRYGNGQTAGQIATRAGFGNALLYGPGNSQPHTVACGRHLVDVHASKAHHGAACVQAGPTSQSSMPQSHSESQAKRQVPTSATTSVFTTSVASNASSVGAARNAATGRAPAGGTVAARASTSGTASQGGVLGASAARSAARGESGGVLGALTAVGGGTLPFTGFPLWAAGAIGLALLVLGGTLARRARSTA